MRFLDAFLAKKSIFCATKVQGNSRATKPIAAMRMTLEAHDNGGIEAVAGWDNAANTADTQ